jgi:hypothetical protein
MDKAALDKLAARRLQSHIPVLAAFTLEQVSGTHAGTPGIQASFSDTRLQAVLEAANQCEKALFHRG